MVHPDFYGTITGIGERRSDPVGDDTRGPDSVECSPDSHYSHYSCALDFTGFGKYGFICGCVCHDDPDDAPGEAK